MQQIIKGIGGYTQLSCSQMRVALHNYRTYKQTTPFAFNRIFINQDKIIKQHEKKKELKIMGTEYMFTSFPFLPCIFQATKQAWIIYSRKHKIKSRGLQTSQKYTNIQLGWVDFLTCPHIKIFPLSFAFSQQQNMHQELIFRTKKKKKLGLKTY